MVVIPFAIRFHARIQEILIIGNDGSFSNILKFYDASPYFKELHESVIPLLGILLFAILSDGTPAFTKLKKVSTFIFLLSKSVGDFINIYIAFPHHVKQYIPDIRKHFIQYLTDLDGIDSIDYLTILPLGDIQFDTS